MNHRFVPQCVATHPAVTPQVFQFIATEMHFKHNIKILCRHHGLTLESLAQKAEVRPDWLRRAVSDSIEKITKSNRQQITRVAMVLNVEPESLFAGTAAKPIDPRYTNELKEVLDFTNQMLAYRDRKVNEYVQIILDTYCIPPRHPEQFKLKDGIRAIILDSEMDNISNKLSELLTPYNNVTHNQPDTVPFTWRGVTPDYQHKSLRSKGADIRQSLRSRGFDDENVVRVMCAYYDHFKVFWWREHHLPTLDALLRDADPEVMPKPLSDWRLYNDSDNHPAQLSIEAGTIVDSLMEASVSERDAVRALNYYWDKHCITGWRENKIDRYIDDIKKMIAQETQS